MRSHGLKVPSRRLPYPKWYTKARETSRQYRKLTTQQDAHDHPRHSQMPGRLFILSIGFDPGEMRHAGVTALGYVRVVHAARLTTSIVTFYI